VIPTAQSPSFKLQYYPIVFYVPSIHVAVFCNESIECFLVWLPNCSLNLLLLFRWFQLLLV
jgi:hypothetical protein